MDTLYSGDVVHAATVFTGGTGIWAEKDGNGTESRSAMAKRDHEEKQHIFTYSTLT